MGGGSAGRTASTSQGPGASHSSTVLGNLTGFPEGPQQAGGREKAAGANVSQGTTHSLITSMNTY